MPGVSPTTAQLELIVAPGEAKHGWGRRGSGGSVFPITNIKLTSAAGPVSVTLDGQVTVKTPVTVEVAKKKLAVIVGKGREF